VYSVSVISSWNNIPINQSDLRDNRFEVYSYNQGTLVQGKIPMLLTVSLDLNLFWWLCIYLLQFHWEENNAIELGHDFLFIFILFLLECISCYTSSLGHRSPWQHHKLSQSLNQSSSECIGLMI